MLTREHYVELPTSSWDWIDVLFLALAHLPEGVNRLTADAGKWNQAVAELKEQFPEIFALVHFEFRPPLPPHSDRLDKFFFLAGISSKLEITGDYTTYHLSDATKAQIRERRGHKLASQEDSISKISAHLQQQLVV